MTKTRTPPAAAVLTSAHAAAYLDISIYVFNDTVRPFLPVVSIEPPGKRPQLRWRVADLDAFVAARTHGRMRTERFPYGAHSHPSLSRPEEAR